MVRWGAWASLPPSADAEGVGKEPPVPSPDVLRAIRSLAPFVARMGPAFEALALQKNSGHPDFRFLYGGEGREYYRWKVSLSCRLLLRIRASKFLFLPM